MRLDFTDEEVIGYINGQFNYCYYDDCVKEAKRMAIHADGDYPGCLIEERRPNEPQDVKDYRFKIWVPKTKPTFTRVYNSLQKIRRSSDWSVRYKDEEFSRIPEGETLEDYCEKNYPFFTSLTNWVFQVMLRKYLIDSNGAVMVMPMSFERPENEFYKPIPYVFGCEDVIDLVPEDYAVLRNPVGCKYKAGKSWEDGESYFFVTSTRLQRFDQVNGKRRFQEVLNYEHNLGVLPVIPWKGSLVCNYGPHMKYESRIAGMIPELDEAVREYSDLQAAKVLHTYPERWEFAQNECLKCKGKGQAREIINGSPCDVTCETCEGRGYVATGPYSKIMVRPVQGLEAGQQVPTPPAGYVEKDVEIIKLQEAGVEQHIYNALAAVNMEYLANSPLATSGVSKAEDKYEAGNMAHSVAEDIVSLMDSVYEVTAKWRYGLLYPSNEIEEMLPVVAVPEKFDLVTSNDIGAQLKIAQEGKANPTTINAIQVEYAHKKFQQEPKVRDMVALTIKLDPLAGILEEDKMSRLSNKGITQLTYIVSSNIQEFVQQAVEEDSEFIFKDLTEQKKVITGMAQKILDEQEAKRQELINGVQQDNQEDSESDQGLPADNSGSATGGDAGVTNPVE